MENCEHEWKKTETDTAVTDSCEKCGETVTMDKPKPEQKQVAVAPRSVAPVMVGDTVRPLMMTDMESGWRMAAAFAKSGMLPKAYYTDGQEQAAAKAFTAMQLGAEVGLPPMQSIQSIAIVNGNATIWGDTQKALVERSGLAEYVRESYEGGDLLLPDGKTNMQFKAVCVTKRVGRDEVREEFSVADAISAGLWGKSGPWKTHPKRMIRYKARAYCLRDVYPDVLKGLTHSAEEMAGEIIDVTIANDITPAKPTEKLNRILEGGAA